MSHSASNPQRANLFERPLPPGYRDEISELIAGRPAIRRVAMAPLCFFSRVELRLALPMRVAAAVAPVLHIARVPHRSGTVLLGLVAFHGDILPCCSLARLLDIPQEQVKSQIATARTLILEELPGRRWAMPIDGVIGVRVADHQISEPAATLAASSRWFRNSFNEVAGPGQFLTYHVLDYEVLFRQLNLATA